MLSDSFEIISVTGDMGGTSFFNELLPSLASGLAWNVVYGANNVVLDVM